MKRCLEGELALTSWRQLEVIHILTRKTKTVFQKRAYWIDMSRKPRTVLNPHHFDRMACLTGFIRMRERSILWFQSRISVCEESWNAVDRASPIKTFLTDNVLPTTFHSLVWHQIWAIDDTIMSTREQPVWCSSFPISVVKRYRTKKTFVRSMLWYAKILYQI